MLLGGRVTVPRSRGLGLVTPDQNVRGGPGRAGAQTRRPTVQTHRPTDCWTP